MKCIYELKPGCYYLFESHSSSRSCYFENEEEISFFKKLFNRYLGRYVVIDKMFLGSEGYEVLVKIREKLTIISNYEKQCKRNKKDIRTNFIKEPWRIISEQMRIFKSIYVKAVNRMRGRRGVLVQSRYNRYYFSSAEELKEYKKKMEQGKEIRSQDKEKYRVEEKWIQGVRWGVIRGKEWVDGAADRAFKHLVVPNLIKLTLFHHAPPKSP